MEVGAAKEILGNVHYMYTLLNTIWHRAIINLFNETEVRISYTRGTFHRETMNILLSLTTLHLGN